MDAIKRVIFCLPVGTRDTHLRTCHLDELLEGTLYSITVTHLRSHHDRGLGIEHHRKSRLKAIGTHRIKKHVQQLS